MQRSSIRTPMLVALAMFAATLDILGILDIPRVAVFGYQLDVAGRVVLVETDSAAAAAGMRRGDTVVSIDGLAFGPDARRRSFLVEVGGRRTLEVSRDGQPQTLEMTARALSPIDQRMGVVTGLSGLLFIFGGLGLYLRSRSTPALAFAAVGLTLGVVQGFRPLASSWWADELLSFGYAAAGALCLSLLVHFAFIFPRQLRAATSRFWLATIYAPAFATILLDAAARLVPGIAPKALQALDMVTLGGQLWLIYLLAWLTLLTVGCLRTQAAERKARGLYVLVWGTAAAIVPILVAGLILLLAPDSGTGLLQLAFVPSLALPLVLGYAVWKSDSTLGHHG